MIRFLTNYFRQCFCKHKFNYEESYVKENDRFDPDEHFLIKGGEGVKVSATCEKCGYHRSYWKY